MCSFVVILFITFSCIWHLLQLFWEYIKCQVWFQALGIWQWTATLPLPSRILAFQEEDQMKTREAFVLTLFTPFQLFANQKFWFASKKMNISGLFSNLQPQGSSPFHPEYLAARYLAATMSDIYFTSFQLSSLFHWRMTLNHTLYLSSGSLFRKVILLVAKEISVKQFTPF